MTYGYMMEESGYNVWVKGHFALNQELKGSTMELITKEEGNKLIGHLGDNEFVIHFTVQMATLWGDEADTVWDGIPMFNITENSTGDPDIQDYIDFLKLLLDTAEPDMMLFKEELRAWNARRDKMEAKDIEEPLPDEDIAEEPISREELVEMVGEELADRMLDPDRELEFDLSWVDEPPMLVERLRAIRAYIKEHPEAADIPPEA